MSAPAAPGIVSGYLSIDHSVAVLVGIEPGRTALVGRRLTGENGRLGGTVAQVSLGLAANRRPIEALSWVGDDRNGSRIIQDLAAGGVGVRGIDRRWLDRTATTWLCYGPDDSSYCIYDPGGRLPVELTDIQASLASAAPWCVVTVGPPGPTAALLDLISPDAMVVWSVKADPLSFTAPVVERLAARAHIILWSGAEASFLTSILGGDWHTYCRRRGALLVETRGANGCSYADREGQHTVAASARIPVQDPTGAGDRMVAGLLAAVLAGEPVESAVRAGGAAAVEFLEERAAEERALTPDDAERQVSDVR